MPDFADVVTSPGRRAGYEQQGFWDDSTLAGRVAVHASTIPDRTAVVDDHGRWTWRQMCEDAAAFAVWLAGAGVGPGQVVSVQLPNRYEFVVSAVAIQSLGAVVNPLLPNYRARELVNVFATARPAVIVSPAEYRGQDYRQLLSEVSAATGVSPHSVVVDGEPAHGGSDFSGVVAGAGRAALAAGEASAVSELIFTSGTEARPKAIMHTEQTTNFSVRTAWVALGVSDADVVWMPSPLGHSTGFNYGMRFALYHGLPLVLQDRWDPDQAVKLVTAEGCSYTLAATTFLRDLVGATSREGADLKSLRAFGCGGAPVPPALVDEAAEAGIQVLRLYGSTEVLVATWNRPETPPDRRRHTDGLALPDVEIEVRAGDGRPVAAGQEGELYVRGPNTCVGFFDDPERTAATFDPEGWVRSGDLVTSDEAGYITVVGRYKEIIIRGGINIAPREIEELLVGFDEVAHAAVVGVPDERLGERMCACLVLVAGATLDLETAVTRLRALGVATYKLPERLEIVGSLPTTASGKVQKHELLAALSGPPA